ncbi:MAG: sigma-70 family RNA polymerase sigma factor [Myxococcota bacterium]
MVFPTPKRELVAAELVLNRARLRAFARARVPTSEVDDVLQLAAVRAVEHSDTLRDPDRVLPWLYRVLRNVITDEARRRAVRQKWTSSSEAEGESVSPTSAEICRCSLTQVNALSANYRDVLKLVDLGDATLHEAALTLGVTVNNATVRLHRARQALRKQMAEHCGVTSLRECADCRCATDGCCAI